MIGNPTGQADHAGGACCIGGGGAAQAHDEVDGGKVEDGIRPGRQHLLPGRVKAQCVADGVQLVVTGQRPTVARDRHEVAQAV